MLCTSCAIYISDNGCDNMSRLELIAVFRGDATSYLRTKDQDLTLDWWLIVGVVDSGFVSSAESPRRGNGVAGYAARHRGTD